MKPDFSSSILQNLTEEEKIEIYKEVIEYQKSGILANDSLLNKTAVQLNQMSFKNNLAEEIVRVELFVGLSLATKYITEHHL